MISMSTFARPFAEKFLKGIRDFVDSGKLKIDRLPKWVKSASVKFVKLNNSNIFLFDDSPTDKDLRT